MSLAFTVLFGQTVAMLLASVLLAYPVVRYSANVAYTEGMVAYAFGFFALSAGWAVHLLTDAVLAYRLIVLVAAVMGLVGSAYFAKPFVRDPDEYADGGFGEPTGGSRPGEGPGSGGESRATDDSESTDDGGFGDAIRE